MSITPERMAELRDGIAKSPECSYSLYRGYLGTRSLEISSDELLTLLDAYTERERLMLAAFGGPYGDDMAVDDGVRVIKDESHAAEIYRAEIHKCQVALDMRCVDDPARVGCADLEFEVHNVCAALRSRLETLESVGGEVRDFCANYLSLVMFAKDMPERLRPDVACPEAQGLMARFNAALPKEKR